MWIQGTHESTVCTIFVPPISKLLDKPPYVCNSYLVVVATKNK